MTITNGVQAGARPRSWLECRGCGQQYPVAPYFFGCPACAEENRKEPLEMRYEARTLEAVNAAGIWRWQELLPDALRYTQTSLFEGGTALVPLQASLDHVQLYLKNETTNPTWSWKDRPNCVSVSMAKHYGFGKVTAISTGNHGNAVAAYASAAGLESVIFCHPETPAFQLAMMQNYGARVVVGGDQESMLRTMLQEGEFFPCTILCPRAGYTNAFGVEGFKTIAFEIREQMKGRAPDLVFVPTGSGDGIYGIWKGFRELAERGLIARAPRLAACQAEGADSLYRAWKLRSRRTQPLDSIATNALSVGELVTGNHALRAVYESQGLVITCNDQEIETAQKDIQRRGFALEPSSALSYACARKMAETSSEGGVWVIIASGAAAKWPDAMLRHYEASPVLAPETSRLPQDPAVEDSPLGV